ncbi:hypothetical protein MRX96_059611 [Rhipicephalus microplus]
MAGDCARQTNRRRGIGASGKEKRRRGGGCRPAKRGREPQAVFYLPTSQGRGRVHAQRLWVSSSNLARPAAKDPGVTQLTDRRGGGRQLAASVKIAAAVEADQKSGGKGGSLACSPSPRHLSWRVGRAQHRLARATLTSRVNRYCTRLLIRVRASALTNARTS